MANHPDLNGPSVEHLAGATRVHIKMPAGTSVAKADGFCKSLGSGTYDCGTSEAWVDENSGETYEFKLKIAGIPVPEIAESAHVTLVRHTRS